MKTQTFRRFLWSALALFALALISLDLYVIRFVSGLPLPDGQSQQAIAGFRWVIAAISIAALALLATIALLFIRSYSRRIASLRRFIMGLPDPLPDDELPAGDDELGALAQSLRQTAPQIRELVERLKLEGARREAILASMVEGVLAVDKDLRVTFCNNSFAKTMGVPQPAPGIALLELVRDKGLLDVLVTALSSGKSVERRLQLRAAEAHSFEVQAAPLVGTSSGGAIVILHDITELERLERVRKDFVANVSHELRTPLAAIRGYSETLLDGGLEDQQHNRKFVEVILAHAIRLNNIASDLLVLSELESGDRNIQPKAVSIRSALESAIRTVEPSARLRSIQITAGQMEDYSVIGFEIRLEQAFLNLLDNAVKFNRPNGEVRVETGPLEGGKVAITIADNGMGIPSDDLPRIFERFYRADKARSREVGGTGLGLSIVRHVVEQTGGAIRVESELGKGSRFTVILPMESAPAQAAPVTPPSPAES